MNEPSFYFKREGDNDFLVVCLHVDHMIHMGSGEPIVIELKTSMVKKFEMLDLGLLHYFLSLEAKQAANGISFPKENKRSIFCRNLTW